jgi:hypothetical protein
VSKLTATAWAVVLDDPAGPDTRHLVHTGDRCYASGCNRPFEARENVAYTKELPGRQPVCASHVEEDRTGPAADSNDDSNGGSQYPPRTHGSIPPRSGLVTEQEACYA